MMPNSSDGERLSAGLQLGMSATPVIGGAAKAISNVFSEAGSAIRGVFRSGRPIAHVVTAPTESALHEAGHCFSRFQQGSCFTAGTQVVVDRDETGRYITKSIEDVREGDELLACDVATGQAVRHKVAEVFANRSHHLRHLNIRHENGALQEIATTDVHPFWVVTDTPDADRAARAWVEENGVMIAHGKLPVTERGFYVEAGDLRVGDVLLQPDGGTAVLTATERELFVEAVAVFNIKVVGEHNYYVAASADALQRGATPVLVHNGDVCIYVAVEEATGQKYYGITNNLPRRTKEHLKNGIGVEGPLAEGLTREEARAGEQFLIDRDGLENLANKINSIAPKNQSNFIPETVKMSGILGGAQ